MSKPRIIGGVAKGRSLETPKSGTRPSPSRLREALFNMLEFRTRGTFLDLFSGSGAIGLEAASRGWHSTCVDLSRPAVDVITRNARNLGLTVTAVRADALEFIHGKQQSYDVVFAAPPYPLELLPIYQAILDADVAKPGGLYIFQHPTQLELNLKRAGQSVRPDLRRYGSNVLGLIAAEAQPQMP